MRRAVARVPWRCRVGGVAGPGRRLCGSASACAVALASAVASLAQSCLSASLSSAAARANTRWHGGSPTPPSSSPSSSLLETPAPRQSPRPTTSPSSPLIFPPSSSSLKLTTCVPARPVRAPLTRVCPQDLPRRSGPGAAARRWRRDALPQRYQSLTCRPDLRLHLHVVPSWHPRLRP